MTEFSGREPLTFKLELPPPAEARSEDERSVHLLADPDVRAGLAILNDHITHHYQNLEAQGNEVHELHRGATARGWGVAVAEYRPSQEVETTDQQYRQSSPIFPDGRYVVFVYSLESCREAASAHEDEVQLQPMDLTDVFTDRGGQRILMGADDIGLALPLKGGQPKLSGEAVNGFMRAAFGKRRFDAAYTSLQWLLDEAWKGTEKALPEERPAALERRDKIMGIAQEFLDQMYQHPEWVDQSRDGVLLPAEKEVVRAAKQESPRDGTGQVDKKRLISWRLEQHRLSLLKQLLGE